jgi:hypothetical protein
LGTGEAVYLESLANKLHMSLAIVQSHLKQLGFEIVKHGRWPAVITPDSRVLDDKLAALGVDTSFMKPMAARVNGYYHQLDSITGCEPCFGGHYRFQVRWTCARDQSSVACTDLNNSARGYVCLLLLFRSFIHMPFAGYKTVRYSASSSRQRAAPNRSRAFSAGQWG